MILKEYVVKYTGIISKILWQEKHRVEVKRSWSKNEHRERKPRHPGRHLRLLCHRVLMSDSGNVESLLEGQERRGFRPSDRANTERARTKGGLNPLRFPRRTGTPRGNNYE